MASRIASCFCGQLQIEVQGEPLGVHVCHCVVCQRRTGSAFGYLASFVAPFKVIGTANVYSWSDEQGDSFTSRFCPTCGSTVFSTYCGDPKFVTVEVGSFADNAFPPPQKSLYGKNKHGWVQLPAAVAHYEAHEG